MAKAVQDWYESDDSLPSSSPSSEHRIAAMNTSVSQPITISRNMLVPSCITVRSGSIPTERCNPEEDEEENSCSTPPFKAQYWNDDYSAAKRQIQYENSAIERRMVISAAVNTSEREIKVAASEGNIHPKNNSTNNYAYNTRRNSHARTRRASGIKPPSALVTFEALEEQRLKCELSPCKTRSIFCVGECCSNERKQQHCITDSTSEDLAARQHISAYSDLLHTSDCYSRPIRTHCDDQAATSEESSPPLYIPTPPSTPGCNTRNSSSHIIQPKDGSSKRLRVTVRVVNSSATNGRNDGLNSEHRKVITQGCNNGEIIVTNPSKVSKVAVALSKANLASFDWEKVFHFDATIVVDTDATTRVEHHPGKEMEDVFESAVSPVLQRVFHEGISGAIFALQPQTLPCTQRTSAENVCVHGMFNSSNNVKGDGASSISQRACLEIGQYLDKRFFIVSLCFFHIGDNGIRDLLNEHHVGQNQHPPIRVREHPETGPFAENATHVQVENANELQEQLQIGALALKNLEQQQLNGRTTGCAMLIMDITRLVHGDGYDCNNVHASHDPQRSTEVDGNMNSPKHSDTSNNIRLCLIDLATKLPISSTDPSMNISSLSSISISPPSSPMRESSRAPTALGKLLNGLAIDEGSRAKTKKGIPWRDSNTTWLLQGILGKLNAQASILVTVSSSASNYHQSMVTLLYVERIIAPHSKNLGGQAGKCGTSNRKPPHASSPETHEKVKQLLCDLKEDRGEIASALLFHTVADPRQRIAKLMCPPVGRYGRNQAHDHNHAKEKMLFSPSSMEQPQHEGGNNMLFELEKTTPCGDYLDQKPERAVRRSSLLEQVQIEQPQNSSYCITSIAHANQKEQATEESQENSNLTHNGNASEFKSHQSSNLTKEQQHQIFRSFINELEGGNAERKSIIDTLSEQTLQHQTPESHRVEENSLLHLYNGLHDTSRHDGEVMSEAVVVLREEDIIKEERLKKRTSDAEEFKRALKAEGISISAHHDKCSECSAETSKQQSSICFDGSSSTSSDVIIQVNKCCIMHNNKQSAIPEAKKIAHARGDLREMYVKEDGGGGYVREEEASTQATTVVTEQLRVGEGVNKKVRVLGEAHAAAVHAQSSRQNQLQEAINSSVADIHEVVKKQYCDDRRKGSMERAVVLPERITTTEEMVHLPSTSIPFTNAGHGPKAMNTTEEMPREQAALAAASKREVIVEEDGEGDDHMQVLVQMLAEARILTSEFKRELNTERTAHQATKDELNRILLSAAASNKARTTTLEQEGGSVGYDDDVAVVVGQEETTSNSLMMELKRLASELKIERSAKASEIQELELLATRRLEEVLSAVLECVKKQAGTIRNLIYTLTVEKAAAEEEALRYSRLLNETKAELECVDDSLIYMLEVEGVSIDSLISQAMNLAQPFSSSSPSQRP